jgi:hypothetical protein
MRRSVLVRAYYEMFPMAHQPGEFLQGSCGATISRNEGREQADDRSICGKEL